MCQESGLLLCCSYMHIPKFFVCHKVIIEITIFVQFDTDITPIETYKVETIDTVSFENSHLANLRDLDQNSNVQLGVHTPGVTDMQPSTPGTVTGFSG